MWQNKCKLEEIVIILTINNFLEVNASLSLVIKKEMDTRNQNYSFIEKDPLLFKSAKNLALLNNKGSKII